MHLNNVQLLREWRRLVNMTLVEVRAWQKNPRHRHASTATGWGSLNRIERMLSVDPATWTDEDWQHAATVVNFNARHLASTHLFGPEVARSGWSKRAIALRNWGHDPGKPTSPAHKADVAWLAEHAGAKGRRYDK